MDENGLSLDPRKRKIEETIDRRALPLFRSWVAKIQSLYCNPSRENRRLAAEYRELLDTCLRHEVFPCGPFTEPPPRILRPLAEYYENRERSRICRNNLEDGRNAVHRNDNNRGPEQMRDPTNQRNALNQGNASNQRSATGGNVGGEVAASAPVGAEKDNNLKAEKSVGTFLNIRTPRSSPPDDSFQVFNPYEDPEEINKALIWSHGHTLPEFIAAVSRFTRDSGRALEAAMKADAADSVDYIENIASQYMKDITELLDEQQSRELHEIRKDIEKWEIELSNVKKRLREMIPDFDVDLYKKDPNYIRKMFSFSTSGFSPEDDPLKKYRLESANRLKAIKEMINNVKECNVQARGELAKISLAIGDFQHAELTKYYDLLHCFDNEFKGYESLKKERDNLFKEYSDLLAQAERMGC